MLLKKIKCGLNNNSYSLRSAHQTKMRNGLLSALLFYTFPHFINSQAAPECQTFAQIYGSGQALCENMWDQSFKYVENEPDTSYTMWFFDDTNPNDQITQNRGINTTDECLLNYFHRNVTAETKHFSECHPWKEAACCYESTVKDVDTILNAYGAEYRWDRYMYTMCTYIANINMLCCIVDLLIRCGPLSQACERFFVQEACFYECDPNVGLYRYQGNHSWKVYEMPIKASYCDAWFRACRNDYFCASDSGSYFSCAKEYKLADTTTEQGDAVNIVLIVVIVIIALLLVFMLAFICFVRSREQKGNPYFAAMDDDDNKSPPTTERVSFNEMTTQ